MKVEANLHEQLSDHLRQVLKNISHIYSSSVSERLKFQNFYLENVIQGH